MRNFVVLGASALVLALGVAQASAIPSTEQWQDHLNRMSSTSAPAANSDFVGFRAQAVDQDQSPSLYHRGR
jgi:outer membrane lipoprotein-sorting protein